VYGNFNGSVAPRSDLHKRSALWLEGYRPGNTATKSEVLLDIPFEYYDGVAEGTRDFGPYDDPVFSD
jgi:hypothetical protein